MSQEPPLPGSAGPLDIAMDEARHDVSPTSPARVLLEEQSRLLRQQTALARHEHLRSRIKLIRDGALTAAVAVFLLSIAYMVWDASHSRATVFEALSVPPALAQTGLTGEAAANRLLDRVDAMQASVGVGSGSQRRTSVGARDDMRVQIPQTGLSLGELLRLLRRELGHDTVVSGELTLPNPQMLSLTVRVDGTGARTFTRPAGEADALFSDAAEALMRRTDGYRFALWLGNQGRTDEALGLFRHLSYVGTPRERALAFSGVASQMRFATGDFRQAENAARRAVELDPELPPGWGALWEIAMNTGREELSLHALTRLSGLSTATQIEHGTAPERVPTFSATARGNLALARGDGATALAAFERAVAGTSQPSDAYRPGCLRVVALVLLHRPSEAAAAAQSADLPDMLGRSSYCRMGYAQAALEREDWAALTAMPPLTSPRPDLPPNAELVARDRLHVRSFQARGLSRAGPAAEALALIASTPLDCTPCLRARAEIAERAGDRAAADGFYAEAVRLAPSVPFAYAEWGRTRLARGDVDGALRLFRQAQERGPRWADPLKYEGDALSLRRDWSGALSRYAAAAERAPRWGALHLAWGRALAAFGRPDDARAKWRAAAGMDLSPADRAEVNRLLGGRS